MGSPEPRLTARAKQELVSRASKERGGELGACLSNMEQPAKAQEEVSDRHKEPKPNGARRGRPAAGFKHRPEVSWQSETRSVLGQQVSKLTCSPRTHPTAWRSGMGRGGDRPREAFQRAGPANESLFHLETVTRDERSRDRWTKRVSLEKKSWGHGPAQKPGPRRETAVVGGDLAPVLSPARHPRSRRPLAWTCWRMLRCTQACDQCSDRRPGALAAALGRFLAATTKEGRWQSRPWCPGRLRARHTRYLGGIQGGGILNSWRKCHGYKLKAGQGRP